MGGGSGHSDKEVEQPSESSAYSKGSGSPGPACPNTILVLPMNSGSRKKHMMQIAKSKR